MNLSSWRKCQKCGLHVFRRKVVLGRGKTPADILFIGEAPGKSEDLRGFAFIGPAGQLLDDGMDKAAEIAKLDLPTFYITNVVACRPTDKKHGPNREPTGEEAWACWVRLSETYDLVNPKAVVFLGKVAEQYCKAAWPGAFSLQHPAYILRQGGARSTEFKRFSRDLGEIFKLVHSQKEG